MVRIHRNILLTWKSWYTLIHSIFITLAWCLLFAPLIQVIFENFFSIPIRVRAQGIVLEYDRGGTWDLSWRKFESETVGPGRWSKSSDTNEVVQSKEFENWCQSIQIKHHAREFRYLGCLYGSCADVSLDMDPPVCHGFAYRLVLPWYFVSAPASVLCILSLVILIVKRRKHAIGSGFPVVYLKMKNSDV